MLKGQVFSEQIFKNEIFALFMDTILNGQNGVIEEYKNGMAVSYSGSNVSIASGAACVQGRIMIEDSSTTLNAGTDSLYCKLVIEIDLDKTNTENDFQQAYYKIVTSSSGYPTLTQTDIKNNNSGVYQYELARFRTSSNGISDFQDMRTYVEAETKYKKNSEFHVFTSEKVTSGNYGPAIEEVLPTGWTSENCVIISVMIGQGSGTVADNWSNPGAMNEYTNHIYSWLSGNRIGVHTNLKPADGANWLRAVLMKIS